MAEQEGQRASTREKTAPDPEDPRKPDSLGEITKRSWKYVLRKTAREFSADQATDLAAALTYYGTLAVFPALLAFVSLIGLFGDPERTTAALLDLASGLVPESTLAAIREPIEGLATSPAAGITFVTGIAGALWSASGYVGAFARAMNRIYSIQEGRPFWKLRPVMLMVTVLALVVAVLAAAIVVLSGPVVDQVGQALGIGDGFLVVWNIIRWPILAGLAVLIVAVLFYFTPNVQQPKFRWIGFGALVAIVTWVITSAGFAFYVSNFSSYNETYGSIGGVIAFLLWVWISNIALLFGAELDAEIERGRELQAGIKAEETIQLPPRDTRQSDKIAKQHDKDVALGRELRLKAAPDSDREQKAAPGPDSKALKGASKRMRKMNRMLRKAMARQR